LLRRPGRRLLEGGAPRRPPVVRRGLLLLASGLAAGAIAPHAAGDPTSTTPAPDPNPPAGAAPDPYSSAPKTTPSTKTAPVRVAPRIYSPPATPVPVTTHRSSGTSSGTRTYTPRPAVTHTRATHTTRKAPRHTHRRVRHVHHKQKPVIVRVTPMVRSYIVSFVDTLSATVVDPADDGVGPGRRRAAGLALAVLCAASLSLILVVARSRRNLFS
jgi:hypothetical protein